MKNYHKQVIDQIISSLGLFDQVCYTEKLAVLHGSTIGQHFRHIIEFYECLINATENGVVNYENRKRNLLIEQDPQYALQVMQVLVNKIATLELSMGLALEFTEDETPYFVNSTFDRELMYLSEHTIHHFALIKIATTNCFQHIQIEKNFGVAPSTIAYQKQMNA